MPLHILLENAIQKGVDTLKGKQWRENQLRMIPDRIFDSIKNESERINLTFEDLYICVLLIYNDINKRLPGPHFDPPSKEQVKGMIKKWDMNLDGEINREEFQLFILDLTADTFSVVGRELIITLFVAPTVAMATKKTTECIPGVGRVVQKLPNSVYASLVTLVAVLFQNSHRAG